MWVMEVTMRSVAILLSVSHFVFSAVALAQQEVQPKDMYIVEVDTTAIKLDKIQGIPVKRLYVVKAGVPAAEGAEGMSSSSIFENFATPQISTNVLKVPMADTEVNGDVKAVLGFGDGPEHYGGGKGGPIFAGPPIKFPRPAPGASIALGSLKLDAAASAAIADGISSENDMTMVFVKGQ